MNMTSAGTKLNVSEMKQFYILMIENLLALDKTKLAISLLIARCTGDIDEARKLMDEAFQFIDTDKILEIVRKKEETNVT